MPDGVAGPQERYLISFTVLFKLFILKVHNVQPHIANKFMKTPKGLRSHVNLNSLITGKELLESPMSKLRNFHSP